MDKILNGANHPVSMVHCEISFQETVAFISQPSLRGEEYSNKHNRNDKQRNDRYIVPGIPNRLWPRRSTQNQHVRSSVVTCRRAEGSALPSQATLTKLLNRSVMAGIAVAIMILPESKLAMIWTNATRKTAREVPAITGMTTFLRVYFSWLYGLAALSLARGQFHVLSSSDGHPHAQDSFQL